MTNASALQEALFMVVTTTMTIMHAFLFLLAAAVAGAQPQASKTFEVTARRFTFDVSPGPFEVNQGDEVTIILSAGDDGEGGSGHGFAMQQYVPVAAEIHPGQSTTIQFTADTAGTFIYFCTRVCGEGHNNMAGAFTVNPPPANAPVIAGIDPTGGPPEGGTDVAIDGANFQPGASVKFGATPAAAVVAGPTRIVATSPPHAPGEVAITVTNPDGLGGTSSQLFAYAVPAPVLAVTRISPDRGSTAGGTQVRIDGTEFAVGATVTFGTAPARNVSVSSSTSLVATTPLGPHETITTSQQVPVVVRNPDGAAAQAPGFFRWELPAPQIALVEPSRGAPGTRVTIRGAGFSKATNLAVRFGGVPATGVQVVDAVTVTAVVPQHAGGAVDVSVTATNGTATARGGFTYTSRRRVVRH